MRNVILILFVFSIIGSAQAQQVTTLYHVNGGVFGTTNYANVCATNLDDGTQVCFDTIGETSVQDILIEGDQLYVAAQDSIVLYDLNSKERIASIAFNAPSTIKMAIHQDYLLVGNWYAPWGHVGAFTNHLRIFDKNNLSFIDSIPEISKPATDIVIHNSLAYIAQNNTQSSGWGDTLGYVSVIDLNTNQFIRNDTLGANGEDLGRMILMDSMLYTLNGASQTITSLNLTTNQTQSQVAATTISPKTYGPTAFAKNANGEYYIPTLNGISTYNLITNTVSEADLIPINMAFAFTYDATLQEFAVAKIDYLNAQNSIGVRYNSLGDSVGTFLVGFSPELLAYHTTNNTSTQGIANNDFQLFPNPCIDHIYVNTTTFDDGLIELFTLNGKQLSQQKIMDELQRVDLSTLSAGTYFIRLKSQHQTGIQKLIVIE